jgi:hypothetical protein
MNCQDRTGQDMNCHDRTGQDMNCQDRTGQARTCKARTELVMSRVSRIRPGRSMISVFVSAQEKTKILWKESSLIKNTGFRFR